jgi:hypothetical protein
VAALQANNGNFALKAKSTMTSAGITCTHCSHVNMIQAVASSHSIDTAIELHYCMSVGLEVGVFGDW